MIENNKHLMRTKHLIGLAILIALSKTSFSQKEISLIHKDSFMYKIALIDIQANPYTINADTGILIQANIQQGLYSANTSIQFRLFTTDLYIKIDTSFEYSDSLFLPLHSPLNNFTYTITVSDQKCSEDYLFEYQPIFTSNHTFQNHSALFTTYPNPASNHINIKLTSAINQPVLIQLFTTEGILVKQSLMHSYNVIESISISDVPNGSYLLKMITSHHSYISKLVILK